MRPILKRVGGKTKLLPDIKARMPSSYRRYFEPFFGGGALFFDLLPTDAILGDTSVELIDTYETLTTHVENVIDILERHREAHRREKYYYEIRTLWNTNAWDDNPAGRAAAFIYLNKTCYNGLWRVNKSGGFNVPRGDYDDPAIFDPDALRAAGQVLAKVSLRRSSYELTTASATAGDFVYFDPPYDPVSKTSNFTAYTKDAFGQLQQQQLADHARELSKRGVQVMLSNSDTPNIRNLYQGFHIDTVLCGRAINSKGGKRGKVNEVLITSYPFVN